MALRKQCSSVEWRLPLESVADTDNASSTSILPSSLLTEPKYFYRVVLCPVKNKHLPRLLCRQGGQVSHPGQWDVSWRDRLRWHSTLTFPSFLSPLLLPDCGWEAWKFGSLPVNKRMKATCHRWRSRKREGAWDVDSIVKPPSSPGGLTSDPPRKEKNYPFFSKATLSAFCCLQPKQSELMQNPCATSGSFEWGLCMHVWVLLC